MPEMPTLGEPRKQSTLIPVAITAVVVGSLTGGIFWLKRSPTPEAPPPAPVAAGAEAPPPVTGEATPAVAPALAAVTPEPAGAPAAVAPQAPSQPAAAPQAGPAAFTAAINGPLESAVVGAVGRETGTALTQVVNRSLVWWLRVPQDLVKGDTLSVVYETREGQEPLVHAVRYESRKLGRTFEAYRFKPQGSAFARYYQADGSELEERLLDSPLEGYEQITSLLRDGRRHKGVDFKAPVGTPVKATFDAVVKRKNWNFRGNGNSVELEEVGGKGRSALYLHLAELPKSLQAGQRVRKGEVFAKSGNTGRSFAPHLHYQLMKGDAVVDPFESHPTTRAALSAAQRPAFDAAMRELQQRLPATRLAGG